LSSTCFEHPSVHPQEDLYMQFYGTAFMRPYKQSGQWQEVLLFTHYVLHKPHKKKCSEVRLSSLDSNGGPIQSTTRKHLTQVHTSYCNIREHHLVEMWETWPIVKFSIVCRHTFLVSHPNTRRRN